MTKAYVAALRCLGRRDYFGVELVRRLNRDIGDEQEIIAAVERCKSEGLVDDERTAHRFVELRAVGRGWGPRKLKFELMRRGLEPGLAERMSRIEGGIFDKALIVALKKSEVRRPDRWWTLPRGRAQMLSSLSNRGFDQEVSAAAVAKLVDERERQHHEDDDEPGDPVKFY